MEGLAKKLAGILMDSNLRIGTVEQCTSGLIGSVISSFDCAERWYRGSIVAYDQGTACEVLDIEKSTIARNDFVSPQVAYQMALGGLNILDVDVCIGIVGYLEGFGSSDVAPGTVQICVAKKIGGMTSFKYHKMLLRGGKRGEYTEDCIETSLKITIDHLLEDGSDK